VSSYIPCVNIHTAAKPHFRGQLPRPDCTTQQEIAGIRAAARKSETSHIVYPHRGNPESVTNTHAERCSRARGRGPTKSSLMRFLLGRTVTVSFIFKEKAEPGAHQQQAGEQQHIHRLAAEALHHPQKHSFAEQSKRALPLPTMQYAHQAGGKNRDRYKVESSMLLRTRDDKQGLGAAGAPPQQKRITHSSRKLQQHARLA